MANQLKMAQVQSITTLAGLGWSNRRIASYLGVHRETVARYLAMARAGPEEHELPREGPDSAQSKPAMSTAGNLSLSGYDPTISTTGNEPTGGSKPAISTAGIAGRRSLCDPFQDRIIEKLEAGLSAQRIWQDMREEHGFEGGYESVKRFVRKLRGTSALPFRRMECGPAEEAQVDFGRGAPIETEDGKRRMPQILRVVLSHSRKGYGEAVFRATTESFIRALENAFRHFGGVPKTLVIDNLRAAVSKADWYDPEINPKIQSFCEHYGTIILPTKPYTPRHKGKVESGVKYVKNNALKGRVFKSLQDENIFLGEWEKKVADGRIHGTTKKQVRKVFESVERPALLPLPQAPFPSFSEARRSVHRDGHVEVAKAYYSVPPEYMRREVWVRWDTRLVRVFNDHFEQIAVHVRAEPGRFRTEGGHIAQEKIGGMERGAGYFLKRARLMGAHVGAWAESLLRVRGIEGIRVLIGLVAMTSQHRGKEIDEACEAALSHGSYRLKTIRELVKRRTDQEMFEFMDEHALIRPLSDYGKMVSFSFGAGELQKGGKS